MRSRRWPPTPRSRSPVPECSARCSPRCPIAYAKPRSRAPEDCTPPDYSPPLASYWIFSARTLDATTRWTIGRALLDGLSPLHDRILCVSGHLSSELVQKAAVAGTPLLVGVGVGAPSSLAIELARRPWHHPPRLRPGTATSTSTPARKIRSRSRGKPAEFVTLPSLKNLDTACREAARSCIHARSALSPARGGDGQTSASPWPRPEGALTAQLLKRRQSGCLVGGRWLCLIVRGDRQPAYEALDRSPLALPSAARQARGWPTTT